MKKADIYDEKRNLMITKSDDDTKSLHKIGTDEHYKEAIDIIMGFKNGIPYGKYNYEEEDSVFVSYKPLNTEEGEANDL